MTIRIISVDFDGCLFHRSYIEDKNKDVIKHNKPFLDAIKKTNSDYSKIYSCVGSNRQSYEVDWINSWSKGSCFPALVTVNAYLEATLSKLLLADIYGDLPIGTSFDKAIDKNAAQDNTHENWKFDDTKATILYAQMHYFANLHPNETIVLDFFDDRGLGNRNPRDILEQLRDFYTKYPDLIPSNLTLRLSHYAGNEVKLIKSIEGSGIIDINYAQTVKDMAAQCRPGTMIFATEEVKPELLSNRKPYPKHVKANSAALQGFRDAMTSLEKKAYEFRIILKSLKANQASKEKIASYNSALAKAEAIHSNITKLSEQYLSGVINGNEFKTSAKAAIDDGREVLETYRGWKQILANLAIAVATLIFPYLLAQLMYERVTGNLLFFRTDSAHKLDELEQASYRLVQATPAA